MLIICHLHVFVARFDLFLCYYHHHHHHRHFKSGLNSKNYLQGPSVQSISLLNIMCIRRSLVVCRGGDYRGTGGHVPQHFGWGTKR